MARKVFLSMLGTGFYSKCQYQFGDFCSSETKFIQRATLDCIGASSWSSEDKILILLTEKAEALNWSVSKRENSDKKVFEYRGLMHYFDESSYSCAVETPRIPEGGDEKDMWEIFNVAFDKLEDGDELYIDLTHSFRYISMLILVLVNYAKFLKNISIKHVSYGNYEAKKKSTNIAPIIDLMPLVALQDWTFASADYLRNGNASSLKELSMRVVTPILRSTKGRDDDANAIRSFVNSLEKVTKDFSTCRGINIIQSSNISTLKESISKLQNSSIIDPLNPVLEKIKDAFNDFECCENVRNGFLASKWCIDNGLYQQAITLLQENIITYLCVSSGEDYLNQELRDAINSAVFIKIYNTPKEEWRGNIDTIQSFISRLDEQPDLVRLISILSELRNDINHSGIRPNPKRSDGIILAIKDVYVGICDIIDTYIHTYQKHLIMQCLSI